MSSKYVLRDPNGNVVLDSDDTPEARDRRRLMDSPIVGGPTVPAPTRYGYGNPPPRVDSHELLALRHRAEIAESRIREINKAPLIVACVAETRGDKMVVGLGIGGVFEIGKLDNAKVGDRVLLVRETLQAVSRTEQAATEQTGAVVSVERSGCGYIEAKVGGELRTIRCNLPQDPEAGNRVVLDPSLGFVVGNLGPPPSPLLYSPRVKVGWDDIGGQDEPKEAIYDAIEMPAEHPELFAGYGKQPSKGVLLHGPPGTGKTMLAKAAATALARIAGESLGASGFVYVKGPELLSGWIGKSEEAIRAVFSGAREHRRTHSYPCVVFIDECEGLLRRRDEGPQSAYIATIVTQFLAEMDGMDERAAIFILATNRIDMIDPAVLRDGRVDRRVYVGRPSKADCSRIAEIKLREVPLRDASADALAEDMWRDDRIVWRGAVPDRSIPGGALSLELRLRDIASGALVAGIVDQATSIALRRDAIAKRKKPGGLTAEDITLAIDRKVGELARQDHRETIGELLARGAA